MVTASGQAQQSSHNWVTNSTQALIDIVTQTLPTDVIVTQDTDWTPNFLSKPKETTTSLLMELGTNVTETLNATPVLTTEESSDYATGATILSLVVMILTCVLIIFGNLIVLIVFHQTPALNNASGIFIKSLACADLGVGICCSFSIHSWFVQKWPYHNINYSCAIVGYTLAVAVGVSIIGLACLSVDRYIAIKKPLTYHMILTKTRARIVAVGVWLVSAGIFMPSLFGWGEFHYNDHSYECSLHWEQNVAFSFFIIAVLVVPALATSTFCYAHILKACFEQTQQMERSEMMFKASPRDSNRGKYERLLAKIFLVIISAFYVTWLPFVITKTLRGLVHINIPPSAMFFFSWLGIVNSFLNCIVYSVGHRSFRDGFCAVIQKTRHSFLSVFSRSARNKVKTRKGSAISYGQALDQASGQHCINISAVPIPPLKETSI